MSLSAYRRKKRCARARRNTEVFFKTSRKPILKSILPATLPFFNDSLCRITGCSKEELAGANYKQFSDKDNSNNVFHTFNNIYKTGEPIEGFDWLIIRKDGTKRYIESSVSLRKNSSDKPVGFKGVIRDITERKRIEQELSYMATHDALTGLPNRLMFIQLLNQAILSAKRHKDNWPFSSSILIASRQSTTLWGTRREICCCRKLPSGSENR